MLGHWFVVGNRLNVKIFTHLQGKETPKLVKTLVNPLGREKNHALFKRQAGMGFKSTGHGGSARYMEIRHDPQEDATLQLHADHKIS